MNKFHIAVATTVMGALAVLLAPQASAEFDKASYLRCVVSDSMSVGGLTLDSSSAGKIGAEAYGAVGGQPQTPSVQGPEIAILMKEHQLSEGVATLLVQCAQNPHS